MGGLAHVNSRMRKLGFAALLWLALVMVLALALDPFGPAARETSGSAFSFFTSDVSLGPTRSPMPRQAPDARGVPPSGGGATVVIFAAMPAWSPSISRATASLSPSITNAAAPPRFVAEQPRSRGPPHR